MTSRAGWRLAFALARLYTSRSPIERGKSRLMNFTQLHLLRHLPAGHRVTVVCDDGRRFVLDAHDPGSYNLMMLGEYDPRETALLRRIIRPGDVVLDIGAHDGRYTTLLALLVGSRGRVHAFEPTPATFRRLVETCAANGLADRVVFNEFALSASAGAAEIFVPEQWGGASLRRSGDANDVSFSCRLSTLDEYCRSARLDSIRLIKCDVEGAEMDILKGASQLLASPGRPMWLLELNRGTARRFHYEPREILELLEGYGYVHHLLNRTPRGSLRPMLDRNAFEDCENVLCSVPSIHGDVEEMARAAGVRPDVRR